MAIGTDIEFGCLRDNTLIVAGKVGCNGMKGNPIMFDTGGVEVDCVSLELTMPPSTAAEEFRDKLIAHMEFAQSYYNVEFLMSDFAIYKKSQLRGSQANTFGCEPDFNVYTGGMQSVAPPANGLRTFGGHIHVSGEMERTYMVVAMDLYVGLYCTAMGYESATRKELYGKAGSYRPKPYGIEYRTVGNGWCYDAASIFEKTMTALEKHKNIVNILQASEIDVTSLRNVIDTADVDVANIYLDRLTHV